MIQCDKLEIFNDRFPKLFHFNMNLNKKYLEWFNITQDWNLLFKISFVPLKKIVSIERRIFLLIKIDLKFKYVL